MRRSPAPWAGAMVRCAPANIGRLPTCAPWSARALCRRRPLMTTGEPSRAQDAVGEYWDALNHGVPRPEVPDLDPSLTGIIDRVRTLDDARSPDPDFVTQLEQ